MSLVEPLSRSLEPDALFDDFGRITNFYYGEFNNLILDRNPNPRRAFWADGEPIGPPLLYFKQIRYTPIDDTKPKLMLAMEGAILDCGKDIHLVFNELGPSIKCWMIVKVRYEPINPDDEKHRGFDAFLASKNTRIYQLDGPVNGWENPYMYNLRTLTERILENNANFIREKSGLQLTTIYEMILKFAAYNPLKGKSWKPLPKYIASKRAIVNIRNTDVRCFGYSLLYFIDPPKISYRNLERPNNYTKEMFDRNKLADLPYPISPREVHKYEDFLETNIYLFSFFDDEGKALYPLYSSRTNHQRTADFFYWNEHYAPIANISRLFSKVTLRQNRKFFCRRCLGHFRTEEKLNRHKQLCTREDFMSVVHVLPEPGTDESFIKFNEFSKTSNAPFVIYADFESILEPIDKQNKQTHYVQQHKVCAAAAILCSYIPEMDNRVMMFYGPDALADFLNELIKWEAMCIDYLKQNIQMKPLSFRENKEFELATMCYLCRQPFQQNDPRGWKVRDHDHITGNYLGVAHRQCNIERPVQYLIPVFFHNLRGYDGHLIVHQFRLHPEREIKVIGQNMEKYLQIVWGKNIVFRDSLQFFFSSLEALASSLSKSGRENFKHLHHVIADRYPNAPMELVERKGVFCYDYLDNFARLDDHSLPTRESFFSRLSNTECSFEDYAHAQRVWKAFECKTLACYMKLYLLTDVCILADVFETFRANSLNEYQLDPAYYLSAPQLAWSALLKFIHRPIHFITDPEMYRMIQPNVRGGICHVSVRYARANNKLLGPLYDPSKPTSYILYVDANNLYGWALSQPMPDNQIELLSEVECRQMESELQERKTRDQFFAYHANSFEEY